MSAGAAPGGQRRQDARELLRRHPEAGAAAAVALAWAALVALALGGARLGRSAIAMPAMPSMAGMAAAPGAWSQAASALPSWALMTVAMMGPAALAGVRHTAVNSLRWRRGRAMAEFAAAYLATWTAFGLAALAVAASVPAAGQVTALSAVLGAAAAWELTPAKRRALRGCHRSVPLPPRGWRAEAGAVRFGLRNGAACLRSCWCLMLVMTIAPAGQVLAWTAGLTVIVTAEKLLPRPRAATQAAATVLAIAGLAATQAAAGHW
jgi:predicted metal-binding membrane protein